MGIKLETNPISNVLFGRVIKSLDAEIQVQTENKKSFSTAKPLHKQALEATTRTASKNSIVEGDVSLKDLRALLRTFPTLTTHQYIFSELYIQALLPFIYGADFKKHELRIKLENCVDELYQFALVCCPRRWGKTLFTAWFTACAMVCLKGIKTTVFSPGKRQSTMFMKLVKQFVNKIIHDTKRNIVINPGENNQEIFSIIVDGVSSMIRVLPANANTSRGVGGDLIICEEAAAMEQDFIEQVVLPVVGPSSTAMVCISTIQMEDEDGLPNWYTRILNLRHPTTGLPIFNVYQFVLACDECIKKKIANKCKCKISELPHWHDEGKQDILDMMYAALNAGGRRMAELLGLSLSKRITAFAVNKIQSLFNEKTNPRTRLGDLQPQPKQFFVSVDPSSGGSTSTAVMVSAVYDGNNMHVVGIESFPSREPADYEPLFLDHLKQLRTYYRLPDADIVIFFENNISAFSRSFRNKVLQFIPNAVCCDKDTLDVGNMQLHNGQFKRRKVTGDTGGLHTDGLVKEAMYHRMKEALNLGSVHFVKEGLSLYGSDDDNTAWNYNLAALKKQFGNFEIRMKVPKPEDLDWNMVKYTYSGKSAGPDDILMATMLNLHWSFMYRANIRGFQEGIPA